MIVINDKNLIIGLEQYLSQLLINIRQNQELIKTNDILDITSKLFSICDIVNIPFPESLDNINKFNDINNIINSICTSIINIDYKINIIKNEL